MEQNKADNSLEDNELEASPGASTASADSSPSKDEEKKPEKKKKLGAGGIKGIVGRLNIYLLLFILILVLAVFVVFIGMQRSKKELENPTVTTTPLTQETLDQINGSDATVGDPKQTLSVESNAIFSGAVLVKGNLDVAGAIKVGGALNLPGLSVSGSSTFDQIAANGMAVSGDAGIQGTLNVQRNLTVGGSAQFGGPVSVPQLSVQSLVLEGDLAITRHIDGGGGTPGVSGGGALGGGGTVSVSGSDTAGTLTINTGGGPAAGCFATITFAQRFNQVPHIVITPVGSAAAGLNFYITRNTSSFQVCTTNPAPGGANFSFDWVAID
jgi:cytoskeletal protein CcmA (bactofilin family)